MRTPQTSSQFSPTLYALEIPCPLKSHCPMSTRNFAKKLHQNLPCALQIHFVKLLGQCPSNDQTTIPIVVASIWKHTTQFDEIGTCLRIEFGGVMPSYVGLSMNKSSG